MFDPNQKENVEALLLLVNTESVEYDKYEFGVPVHNDEFVKQITRNILFEYAVIKRDEWNNIKHMLWVLLRTVESDTDPKKDIFKKMDVEGGYRLVKRLFDCDPDLAPHWEKK